MTVLVVIEKRDAGERLLRRACEAAKGADTDIVLLSLLGEADERVDRTVGNDLRRSRPLNSRFSDNVSDDRPTDGRYQF